jgi:hypothetical protein
MVVLVERLERRERLGELAGLHECIRRAIAVAELLLGLLLLLLGVLGALLLLRRRG